MPPVNTVPDYLGMITAEPGDKVDHGVKGMKWGVRRSSAQLKVAAAKRGEGEASTKSSEKKPESTSSSSSSSSSTSSTHSTTSTVETSQARYSRLAAQAKAGKAHEMSEADLKFFNARTEALAKVGKMYSKDENWLAKTSKEVLRNTAKNSMQAVATAVAQKYIDDRIVGSIKNDSAAKLAESKTALDYIGRHRAKK